MIRRRLLYLATFDPTVPTTGTTTRGQLFLDYFSQRDVVHLVHLADPDAAARSFERVERLASRVSVPYSTRDYFLYSPHLLEAARAVLREHLVDYIFADFEKAGLYARRLAKEFGLPYVYSSHNVEYRRYLDFARRNRLRYALVPWMYFAERRGVSGALLTASISEPDARVFRSWTNPEQVLAAPAAFDETVFHPFYEEKPSEPPVILMVGNYRNPGNRQGAEILVMQILPAVIQRQPEAIFRCVGNHFPAGLSHPNLQVPGFVEDLPAEYRRAALVVAPVLAGGGIKIKAIEALASGKYLITTEKGIEGIDPLGLENLSVGPVESFAGRILAALENPVPKTTRNWERIARGYGVRHALDTLHSRIDSALRERKGERQPVEAV